MYSARDEGHPLLITGREISPRDVYVRVAPFEPQAVDLHFPEHEFSLHRLHIAPFVAGFSDAWEKALTNGVFTTHARQERLLVQRLLSAVEYMEDFHARCSEGRSEGRSPTVEVLWRMAMGEHPLPGRLARYPHTLRRGGVGSEISVCVLFETPLPLHTKLVREMVNFESRTQKPAPLGISGLCSLICLMRHTRPPRFTAHQRLVALASPPCAVGPICYLEPLHLCAVGPCCPEDRWLQQQQEYKRKQAGQSSGPCSYVPPMQSRCVHS